MKQNLKVDFIVGRMNSGGAQRVIANLSNYLIVRGFRVRIITFMGDDAYYLDSRIERLRFHKRNLYKTVITTCFFTLLNFYLKRSNRPDVISAHLGDMGFPGIPIARLYGIPIIVSEHTNHIHQTKGFYRKILWDHLYKYASAITILTKFDLNFFSKKNKRTLVMENPCSFEILPESNTLREKAIIAVGNLNRYSDKGFDSLLNIASGILPEFPDWKLKIVGEGNHGREILEKIIAHHNIQSQVELLGFRTDVADILRSSAIFVLSSKYEGMPMVLLEAMSQRMACIAYDCVTGPAEIIENNINGFLVKDQDTEDMKEKLTELIRNKELRERFGKNAPLALQKYSIEAVGDKWINLFNEVKLMDKPIK